MDETLLIIDDDADMRALIRRALAALSVPIVEAESGEIGLQMAAELAPALVLCDLRLPGLDGNQVLAKLRAELPETLVVMLTAEGSLNSAIQALRDGASDYILKPVQAEALALRVERILKQRREALELSRLRRQVSQQGAGYGFVGQSPAMQEVRRLLDAAAAVKTTVLLIGETGSGKEVVARALHEAGPGKHRPYIAVNCAAVPEHLVESELFGHMRGAFTGADSNKTGLIEEANGGTLFLDEIGDMPLLAQAKLLRVLEERAVRRVGAAKAIAVDIRVIAATHQDLAALVKQGRFREDLLFRLRVLEIRLPPLRERGEDIALLAERFRQEFARELKRNVGGFSNAAMQALLAYRWPGNIRELRNCIERAMLFAREGDIDLQHLPAELQSPTPPISLERLPDNLEQAMRTFERQHIARIIQESASKSEAATRLGVDRSTLYRKLMD